MAETIQEFIRRTMYVVHTDNKQDIEIDDVIETKERLAELITEYTCNVLKHAVELCAKKAKIDYNEDGDVTEIRSKKLDADDIDLLSECSASVSIKINKKSILDVEAAVIKEFGLYYGV